MPRALTLALLLIGCSPPSPSIPAWPPRGPCGDEPPARVALVRERVVTFPERDWVCPLDTSGRPCTTPRPLRSNVERTVIVRAELGGATFGYLLDVLTLPARETDPECPESPFEGSYGLDLDGIDSGAGSAAIDSSCAELNPDDPSAIEPGVLGIDNVFQHVLALAERALDDAECPASIEAERDPCLIFCAPRCNPASYGCFDALLERDIHAGTLLVLLELTGVDSLLHDPAVEVALYAVQRPGGGAPALDTARVAGGQTFESVGVIAPPAPADILHGRVRVRWPRVALPRERYGYPEELLGAELRAGVCARGLFHGHLGGGAPVNGLAAQLAAVDPALGDLGRGLLEPWADLHPSSADPTRCEQISVAYAVEGVPANRIP